MKISGAQKLQELGEKFGQTLSGGEVIELIGDVGAGKTTFTQGIAQGLGIEEAVTSPSFTISNTYNSPKGLILRHYDFYRLNDAGIMKDEIRESINNPKIITVVEWGDSVRGILPENHFSIEIKYSKEEDAREISGVDL